MRLEPTRVELLGDHPASARLTGTGPVALGAIEVGVDAGRDGAVRWSVANRGDRPVRLRAVRLVFTVTGVEGPLRAFLNGYQSWSPCRLATLGVDVDPSTVGRVPRLLRASHHADEEVAEDGELRSESVAVLADAGADQLLVGFGGSPEGSRHDGTLRLRRAGHGSDPELTAEAFLGGARLDPGAERELRRFMVGAGPDHAPLLEAWAGAVGAEEGARTSAPYQVGWCSWYHYFDRVSEADLRSNLAHAADWPFEVFQLDDGFQPAIGDWLGTNEKFDSSLDQLAAAIVGAGRRPGIWLAPFLASPRSEVLTRNPGWAARYRDGERPLMGMWHPVWGGAMPTLDTTDPDVQAHLEAVAGDLAAVGFTYLKLDFTFAPSVDGVYRDPTMTPAERVRAGYDAVRRGAGEDAFILGCGAPLAAVVGVVDGMRIGADVAPSWHRSADAANPSGPYADSEPATVNAWRNTLARSFLHRRFWLNDPDCLMLRRTDTAMSDDAVRTWALAVGLSGGMALVSDDLGLLDTRARDLLDEVLALGRAADGDALAGSPPRCPDLLDADPPTRLTAAGRELAVDPGTASSFLRAILAAGSEDRTQKAPEG
jgi:alpha-galactosidase